jgi:hypothetical protein
LAGLVDAAPEASAVQIRRCALSRTSVAAVLRFGYADGSTQDLAEVAPGCGGVFFVGGRGVLLPKPVGSFVFGLTAPLVGSARAAPALVGLAVPRAVAVARRAGISLDVSTIPDPGRPPWTVLLESPLSNGTVSVLASNPPLSGPCRTGQLRAQYLPSQQVHSWEDAGELVLRNTSRTWCRLAGTIRLSGLAADGGQVTPRAMVDLRIPTDLSPGVPALAPEKQAPADERFVTLLITADFADPAGVRCATHLVVPHTWRIALSSGTLLVANAQGRVGKNPGQHGLVSCGGSFTAQL